MSGDGRLQIKAATATLVVTATDACGNTATCETVLCTPSDSDDDKHHDEEASHDDEDSHDDRSKDVLSDNIARPIDLQVIGSGKVVMDPQRPAYGVDDVIVLRAVPEPGWRFDHWEGYPSGSQNPYAVSVGVSPLKVTAVFSPSDVSQGFGACGAGVAAPASLVSIIGLVGLKRRRRRRRATRRGR